MKLLKYLFLIATGSFCTFAAAEKNDLPLLTIYTASAQGTYYQIASDLKRVCSKMNIQVIMTDGSLDNINQLIRDPVMKAGARFAIVQGDVLTSVMNSEAKIKGLIKQDQPLYNEDISILVSKNSKINSIKDLVGKRVSVGIPGSGTWFSAMSLRLQLNMNWKSVEAPPEDSILSLLTGDVDAMIIVAGHPLKMYTDLGGALQGRVKLLDLLDVQLPKYEKTQLPANTYTWQEDPIHLLSVKAILVSAADVPPSTVHALQSCMFNAQADLKKLGHPKWNEVQFKVK